MSIKIILNLLFILIITSVYSQESTYTSLTIPENLKQHANAVIRLNEVSISIESQKKAIITLKRIVTVLNEKGDRYVQAGSGYDSYVKIKKIEAHIFNDTGKEVKKIRKKDFIDHSAVDGGTLYSDSRVLFMGYTPILYPYTVEFLCEIETTNTASIPTWRPIDDYYLSIEKDNYILKDLANLGLRFKEKNFEGFNIEKSNTLNSINYSISNIIPIKPEDLSPSLTSFTPQALIAVENFHYNGLSGKAKNWVEFGNWIKNSLLEGRGHVSLETKETILNLVKNLDSPIEKAKKIFEFVQNNTRYISVQVGIGGIQPIPAMDVDELKYGDCKGLTNYTQALLGVAGVESYYTVVEAGKKIIDFDSDFASLEQGNHIILGIPNENNMLWLDCTSQIHPFNFIGDFTDNRNVLIIKQDSSEIKKTTAYKDSINYQSTKAKIKLNLNGSIESEIVIKTKGIQYDNRFPIERESTKKVKEYYKKYWSYVNNLDVLNYTFNNDKNEIKFTEKINIQAKNYASINGDRLLFYPNAFNKNDYVPDRYRNRKLPLEIQRGYLDEDIFSFTIPNGYNVEVLPDNVLIKNKFGEYSIELTRQDNEILYKRKLYILSGAYSKEDYSAYRNFRKKILNTDNSKIILNKVTEDDK